MDILSYIEPPYYFTADQLPGLDFNRDIIDPGRHEKFPDGAVGVRSDGDFYTVAVLPYCLKDVPLSDIVEQLWPQYSKQARLCPDHGTVEQRAYFAEQFANSEKRMNKHLNDELRVARKELARLRADRPDLHEHHESRKRAESSYFIRQYEHLLIAVAHENKPREDAKGICEVCGLFGSDRVHSKRYRELHDAGYAPSERHLLEYEADDL